MSLDERLFSYRAVRADGVAVRDVVRAPDRVAAARRLAANDLVVVELKDAEGQAFGRAARITDAERVTILRQLAVMTRAGVDLLEAIETIATGIAPRPASDRLRDVAAALRRGDPLARAFSEHLHGYPVYVYALIRAGEASGRLPGVLAEAADQVAFEEQVRRDLAGALTYPAFLTCAGFGAVSFLLGVVAPRFAAMVGDLSRIDAFPSLILRSGLFVRDNALVVAAVIAVIATALWRAAQTPAVRARLLDALRSVPGARDVLAARARMGWARVMGLALGAGLPVLEASALARGSVADDARFSRALAGAEAALRAGRPVEAAFAQDHALAPIDASLVRAGAKSGALPAMFALIATQHESNLRVALKRTTVIVEQVAIALVASAVGAIVIGLVTALTGIYETIG
ncbi:MAG: type II secretion system F family protein [Alphaproteobacteria bacterium]|nr:type II secretion system F family protein [Alphaproteobacteria bacterium]